MQRANFTLAPWPTTSRSTRKAQGPRPAGKVPPMRYQHDFLVLGSGVAGLSFALQAARHGSVAVLAKRGRSESNTAWAQGGIAAVLSPGASLDSHGKGPLNAPARPFPPEALPMPLTHQPPPLPHP